MARKQKKTKETFTRDSTLLKLKSTFESQVMQLQRSSFARDTRARVMDLNFDVLRNIAKRLSVVSMCTNCREQQIMPFLSPAQELGQPGFIIGKKGELGRKMRNQKEGSDKRAVELMEFFQQTGFSYSADREDDFIDFGKMAIREILTIDQIAVELQRNRRGEVAAFWLLDGATISRALTTGYEGHRDVAFVQEVDDKIVATFTAEDLIFDYMYKRAELKSRGYGFSLLEQAVDLVTTLIMGISYNRDIFSRDKIPKGFIALSGEADDATVQAVAQYWYAAMQGAGGFSIPVLPSGKEGVGIDFKTLGQSNRDMEYHKLMMFFLSLFAAVFGIDLAELGIKTDLGQPMIGENINGRIQTSKDRGLKSLLSFLCGFCNKILSKIDKEYEFAFIGIDPEDEMKKYEVQAKAVSTSRTTNEVRAEEGLDPLEGPEYDSIANQQIVALKQFFAGRQDQEAQQGQEDMGADMGDGDEAEDTGDDDMEDDNFDWLIDEKDVEKESSGKDEGEEASKALVRHMEELMKSGYDVSIDL